MASANQSTFTASQACQLLCDESDDEIDVSDIEISYAFVVYCLNFLCSMTMPMAKMAGIVDMVIVEGHLHNMQVYH